MKLRQIQMPTDASIILTYRCQMRCKMCNIWKYPTDKEKEITAKDLEKLPKLKFINLTGGEPFLRDDIEEIIDISLKKAKRVVISTSGWHVDKIIKVAEKFKGKNLGIRVSIEGLSQKNDYLRGRSGGFDRGLKVLLALRQMGFKDIGFGITVSNDTSEDMLWLYELAKNLKMEFATAIVHNSYYFHKYDNEIVNKDEVIANFHELIRRQLRENNPKSWFRAFFNLGIINYVRGGKRMLPCEAGTVNFFIEPYGDVYPCNGLDEKIWKVSMGNIREVNSFEELWFSERANKVRELVRACPKNCWMIGTAAPVIRKYVRHVLPWVIKNRIKVMLGKDVDINCIPYYDVGNRDSMQGSLDIEAFKKRFNKWLEELKL